VADASLIGADVADGSLTGNDIQTKSIFDDQIATNTLEGRAIAQSAIGSFQIAPSAVNAEELGDGVQLRTGSSVTVAGGVAENGAYNLGQASSTCFSGEELVGGGGGWIDDTNPTGNEELFISEVTPDFVSESVTVIGGNDSGIGRKLVARAYCLEP
jgi:hypothetical protein